MTVKTALNAEMDTVEDLFRQVRRMEQDASNLRIAVLNLLAETATMPATQTNNPVLH